MMLHLDVELSDTTGQKQHRASIDDDAIQVFPFNHF